MQVAAAIVSTAFGGYCGLLLLAVTSIEL